ncbi:hypothetical protein PE067_17930 [Paracoccus sp. DMF-8]|uniref:hypothetical protein n=1 Tax=Paracoccus sp. DMF-8 TaxID=3019445 RepID=UPI0023E3EACA|nr:hypothetical protein [Paracoccus sp. DMF-8]MDF3607856.1 hypothetical protein [Paracoccus sp. DMF-8]
MARSIHAVIEPALIAHARDGVERRIARSEIAVSARFVATTRRASAAGRAGAGSGRRRGRDERLCAAAG